MNTIPSTQASGLSGIEPRRRRVLDKVYATVEANPNQNRDQVRRLTGLSYGSVNARLHELISVGSIAVVGRAPGDKGYDQETYVAIKPPPAKMPPVEIKDPLRKALRLAGRGFLIAFPQTELKRLGGLITQARERGAEVRIVDGPGWALYYASAELDTTITQEELDAHAADANAERQARAAKLIN